MWIPDPLYRALPGLYAASGLSLLVVTSFAGPAAFSAFVLLAVAVIVHEKRARYKAEMRRRRAVPMSRKLLPPR